MWPQRFFERLETTSNDKHRSHYVNEHACIMFQMSRPEIFVVTVNRYIYIYMHARILDTCKERECQWPGRQVAHCLTHNTNKVHAINFALQFPF